MSVTDVSNQLPRNPIANDDDGNTDDLHHNTGTHDILEHHDCCCHDLVKHDDEASAYDLQHQALAHQDLQHDARAHHDLQHHPHNNGPADYA